MLRFCFSSLRVRGKHLKSCSNSEADLAGLEQRLKTFPFATDSDGSSALDEQMFENERFQSPTRSAPTVDKHCSDSRVNRANRSHLHP